MNFRLGQQSETLLLNAANFNNLWVTLTRRLKFNCTFIDFKFRKEEGKQELESARTYFTELEQMMKSISLSQLEKVLELLEKAYRNGQRIFIMGNGGSAVTASRFALDLAKNTIAPGVPRLKAISLTDHVPLITAWSNDTAYEHIFAEQ